MHCGEPKSSFEETVELLFPSGWLLVSSPGEKANSKGLLGFVQILSFLSWRAVVCAAVGQEAGTTDILQTRIESDKHALQGGAIAKQEGCLPCIGTTKVPLSGIPYGPPTRACQKSFLSAQPGAQPQSKSKQNTFQTGGRTGNIFVS